MTFRHATAADVLQIVEMATEFQHTSEYADHLRATPETLAELIDRLLGSPDATILLALEGDRAVGMLAIGLYTQPMSGERIGSEICWWVSPVWRGSRAALKLLRLGEAWALDQGAVVFQMMAPNLRVGDFYARLGYLPIETHYQRRLVA